MKIRTIKFGLLTVMFASLLGKVSTAQEAYRRIDTLDPCPGGAASANIHSRPVRSLNQLVRMSELIVVGTVADVLPAFSADPDRPIFIETHSVVAVEELLYGALPSGSTTILLVQMGGQAGPCKVVVPANPLVQKGEQYVLFLRADKRKRVPETSSLPLYQIAGIWSGKAKVENGKIQFLPRASPGLHEYDNMDATAFIAAVEDTIKFYCRHRDLSFPCLLPGK